MAAKRNSRPVPAQGANEKGRVVLRNKVKVFFSYSHRDEELRDELDAHLALLKRREVIDTWHDRKIVPGREIEPEILAELDSADLILLLISSDFLNSDFCYRREMKRAVDRHESREAVVIPIALRDCDWIDAPFANLRGLPTDMKPVTSWPNRDEALANIAREIRGVVDRIARDRDVVGIASSAEQSDAMAPIESPMSLNVTGTLGESVVSCTSLTGTLERPANCTLDPGSLFRLNIVAHSLPPGGSTGWQTDLSYDSLSYVPVAVQEEILWPISFLPLRAPQAPAGNEGRVSHGDISAFFAPFPTSTYIGPLVRLILRCQTGERSTKGRANRLYLLAFEEGNPSGACYMGPDSQVVPFTSIGRATTPELAGRAVAAVVDVLCRPKG